MSEMVERVARSVFVTLQPEGSAQSMAENGILIVPPHLWAEALAVARAAIEAMREPTEAMLNAAEDAADWANELDERKQAEVAWRAMIDETIRDETPRHSR